MHNDFKKCSKCSQLKSLSQFGKDKYRPDGATSSCKACRQYANAVSRAKKRKNKYCVICNNIMPSFKLKFCDICATIAYKENSKNYHKNYRLKNREHLNQKSKDFYNKNQDQILTSKKAKYLNNREDKLHYQKQYNLNNSLKIREYNKLWHLNNKNYNLEYRSKNRKKVNLNKRNYEKKRREVDIYYRFQSYWRVKFLNKIKEYQIDKIKFDMNIFGYSIDMLLNHLASQFEPWMHWGNWGIYKAYLWDDNDSSTWTWQIDHIIPQSDLPYNNVNHPNFKKCWALENLRPLSAKQNILDGVYRVRHKGINNAL